MKVLPIKLSDELYNNLKQAAQYHRTSMAELIRMYISKPVKLTAGTMKKRTKKRKLSFIEFATQHIYKGPVYNMNKTDDEILYGGKLGDY